MPTQETKTVDIRPPSPLTEFKTDNLKIASLLFPQDKLPLDEFFWRLGRGQFRAALERMDLHFENSNVRNQALRLLIDQGYYPMYLEVTNTGGDPIELSTANFVLDNDEWQVSALTNTEVPRRFTMFDPEVIEQWFEMTAFIVVMLSLWLAVVIGWESICGTPSCDFYPRGSLDKVTGPTNASVMKTTSIDYQNFLFQTRTLEPGMTNRGLLFFRIGNRMGFKEYKLVYTPNKGRPTPLAP